ncbi:MAG: hypothetical protein WDM76_14435 [Limisphaerales bacterium]
MQKRVSLMMFQDTGFVLWLILMVGLCSAQAGDYQWLRTAGGESAEVSCQIVVDDAGSSYIIGGFNSSNCPFGSIVLTNSSRSASPTYDVFVVKYDTKGGVVWAQKFGGTNDDRGSGVAVDASHQCFITGYFVSTNFIIGGVTLTNYAPQWKFVAVCRQARCGGQCAVGAESRAKFQRQRFAHRGGWCGEQLCGR